MFSLDGDRVTTGTGCENKRTFDSMEFSKVSPVSRHKSLIINEPAMSKRFNSVDKVNCMKFY